MATEKWIAGSGAGLTWTDAFSTATLNSITNGYSILSDIEIDNSVALDMFCDVSINLASAAFAAPIQIMIYIFPKNKDNSTYGDGRFGSAALGNPPPTYLGGVIGLVAGSQAQSGSLCRLLIPPGKFKFVLYNNGGVNLAATGNTCQYRTYNLSSA